jgi:hypothetical protein
MVKKWGRIVLMVCAGLLVLSTSLQAAPRHLVHIWAETKASADAALRLEVLAWQAIEKLHGSVPAQFMPVEESDLSGFHSSLQAARELIREDAQQRRGPELLGHASLAYVEARNQLVHLTNADLADLHATLSLAAMRTEQIALVDKYLHAFRNFGGRDMALPADHAELQRSLAEVDARRLYNPAVPLTLSSEPTGARVVVDGVEAGETPLNLSVGVGSHSVVVSLMGHWKKGVLVDAGDSGSSRNISLRPHLGKTRFENALKSVPSDIRKGRAGSAHAGVGDLAVLTGADAVMALVVRSIPAKRGEIARYRLRGFIRAASGMMTEIDEDIPQDATILGVFDGFALAMNPPFEDASAPPPPVPGDATPSPAP